MSACGAEPPAWEGGHPGSLPQPFSQEALPGPGQNPSLALGTACHHGLPDSPPHLFIHLLIPQRLALLDRPYEGS